MTDPETVTVYLPITTCAMCGALGWDHSAVMFADGFYCRFCTPIAINAANRHADAQKAEMMRSGVFHLTRNWSPETP